jgi:acyl carrier protein
VDTVNARLLASMKEAGCTTLCFGIESGSQEILDRIRKICTEALKVERDRITPASRFREDLGADSLDTIVLLMALEEEFKGRISDEEARRLVAVQDVITLVQGMRKAASAPEPSVKAAS